MIFYDLNHHANLGIQKDFYEIIITYMNLSRGKAFPVSFPNAIIDYQRSLVSGQEVYLEKGRKYKAGIFWLVMQRIVNRNI